MTLVESPMDGFGGHTIPQLHEILGLTKERVRRGLRCKTPAFRLIWAGEDPDGTERARLWYTAQIAMRGGTDACREMLATRQHLQAMRLWHRCSWKAMSITLDVTVMQLEEITFGEEVDIEAYRMVAKSLESVSGRYLRNLAAQERDGARLKVKIAPPKSKTFAEISLLAMGKSIRRRRLAGWLGISFVAEQCDIAEEQLCQVEQGRAPRVLVERVDQMLARMLGETHSI